MATPMATPGSTEDWQSRNGLQPRAWGPAYWHLLYCTAANYAPEPTDADKARIIQFLHFFWQSLPCGICRNNFAMNTQAGSPAHISAEIFDSRDALFAWVYRLHTTVSTNLGKVKGKDDMPFTERQARIFIETFRAGCQGGTGSGTQEGGCNEPAGHAMKVQCNLIFMPLPDSPDNLRMYNELYGDAEGDGEGSEWGEGEMNEEGKSELAPTSSPGWGERLTGRLRQGLQGLGLVSPPPPAETDHDGGRDGTPGGEEAPGGEAPSSVDVQGGGDKGRMVSPRYKPPPDTTASPPLTPPGSPKPPIMNTKDATHTTPRPPLINTAQAQKRGTLLGGGRHRTINPPSTVSSLTSIESGMKELMSMARKQV